MENHGVPNQLITASSFYNFYGSPRQARLRQRRVGRAGGSWYAKRNDKRQWLKIDFGGLTRVSQIATQGRQNADQWVTSYYVSYSVKGFRFVTYKEYGRTKVSANFLDNRNSSNFNKPKSKGNCRDLRVPPNSDEKLVQNRTRWRAASKDLGDWKGISQVKSPNSQNHNVSSTDDKNVIWL